MMEIVLTNIPIKCGILDSNVDSFIVLARPSYSLPMMLKFRCGIVSSLGAVHMDGRDAPCNFPLGSRVSPLCILHYMQVPHTGTCR